MGPTTFHYFFSPLSIVSCFLPRRARTSSSWAAPDTPPPPRQRRLRRRHLLLAAPSSMEAWPPWVPFRSRLALPSPVAIHRRHCHRKPQAGAATRAWLPSFACPSPAIDGKAGRKGDGEVAGGAGRVRRPLYRAQPQHRDEPLLLLPLPKGGTSSGGGAPATAALVGKSRGGRSHGRRASDPPRLQVCRHIQVARRARVLDGGPLRRLRQCHLRHLLLRRLTLARPRRGPHGPPHPLPRCVVPTKEHVLCRI